MISNFGWEVIRIASVSGSFSIKARPFSAPITLTAVARASASVALSAIIVTLERPSVLVPIFQFKIWLWRRKRVEQYLEKKSLVVSVVITFFLFRSGHVLLAVQARGDAL